MNNYKTQILTFFFKWIDNFTYPRYGPKMLFIFWIMIFKFISLTVCEIFFYFLFLTFILLIFIL